jgi:hypothetical protein
MPYIEDDDGPSWGTIIIIAFIALALASGGKSPATTTHQPVPACSSVAHVPGFPVKCHK